MTVIVDRPMPERPALRGWLHGVACPLVAAAGVVIVVLTPNRSARIAVAVFAGTAVLLFGVSALYHRGQWGPRATGLLRRLDHANIFLIIAGTYTPFAMLALPAGQARVLLGVVWSGALLGIAFRLLWLRANRWLYTPVYLALGWVAVAFAPEFVRGGHVATLALVALGGLLYTAGAVVYATRRPDLSRRWFGFHEVFHALTIGGFVAHYVGLSLLAYG